MILHLGMIDVPYADGTTTTVQVAEILEARYGIMGVYAKTHMDFIAKSLEDSLAGELESMLGGKGFTGNTDPFLGGTSKIDASFKNWLDQDGPRKEGVPGTPTLASKSGVNHRFKAKKQQGKRVSFIDTSTYMNHFKSWVD